MPGDPEYVCFCSLAFGDREDLIDHNVLAHLWNEHDSRTAVFMKYPEP